MTLSVTSAAKSQIATPALDLRRMFMAMIAAEGLRNLTDLQVAQRGAGANMSVDIAAGLAMVLGDDVAFQGPYMVYNDATFNLTGFSAADPTNPRIDRVVVRVRDAFHGSADNTDAFVIKTGTPTGGATLANLTGAAAIGNGELLLANVLIPATATSVTTANIANAAPLIRPAGSGVATIFDVQVARGLSGDPASGATTIDTNTILGGNIPSTFKHLKIEIQARSQVAAVVDQMLMRFNADSGGNYYAQHHRFSNAVSSDDKDAATTSFTQMRIAGNTAPAATASQVEIEIANYAGTLFRKTYLARGGVHQADSATNDYIWHGEGIWLNAAVLTRIQWLTSGAAFSDGSRWTLTGST